MTPLWKQFFALYMIKTLDDHAKITPMSAASRRYWSLQSATVALLMRVALEACSASGAWRLVTDRRQEGGGWLLATCGWRRAWIWAGASCSSSLFPSRFCNRSEHHFFFLTSQILLSYFFLHKRQKGYLLSSQRVKPKPATTSHFYHLPHAKTEIKPSLRSSAIDSADLDPAEFANHRLPLRRDRQQSTARSSVFCDPLITTNTIRSHLISLWYYL